MVPTLVQFFVPPSKQGKCKMKVCQNQPFFPDSFFFQPPCHLLFSVPCGRCPTGPGSTEDQRIWVPATCALLPGDAPLELLSALALPPAHRPGPCSSPGCCSVCPSGQDISGNSPGRTGTLHTCMSRRGGRQQAQTRVHTCLHHAHTGQGGGRLGTLRADVTYFSSEASRVAWSQCKSLIELGVNYSLPGHVNACAKGFFLIKKKSPL